MNYRAILVRFTTFIGGLYFFLEFILPEELHIFGTSFVFSKYDEQITNGFITVGYMSLGLGLINLLMSHGSTIVFRRRAWIHSVALLFGLAAMTVVTTMDWRATARASDGAERLLNLREFSARIRSDAEKEVPAVPATAERIRLLNEALDREFAEVEVDAHVAPSESENREPAGETLRSAATRVLELMPAARSAAIKLTTAGVSDAPAFEELEGRVAELAGVRGELLGARYELSRTRKMYTFLYDGLFIALGSAMFSLLAFYIASAAYRAFRIKTTESALMMLAAFLVIMGQVPFMLFGRGKIGTAIFEAFPVIRLWLLQVPNSAAFRAIELGAGIAALVMALRMWLSIESESFSEKSE